MYTAFEVTEDDIENVLRRHAVKVANTQGKSFALMANELYADLADVDFGRIERAALNAGVELSVQTEGAYAEIRDLLVDRGVLDLPRGGASPKGARGCA